MLLLREMMKLTYLSFFPSIMVHRLAMKNPKAQIWAQRFSIKFSSQHASGLLDKLFFILTVRKYD